MDFKKAHTNSILRVKYTDGNFKWYRVSKGRSIGALVRFFSNLNTFAYLQLFEYNGLVGRKYFYYTAKGSYEFL
ncbi:MAG: hypothetical protein KGV44_12860 [Flavobacteriaceae bacterium]|nr:hypothetical protein [Flavobacteriaceae bacterium]